MSTAETTQQSLQPRRRDVPGSAIAGRLAGAIGLVLLVTCPLTYLLAGQLTGLFWMKLVLGLAATVTYLVTNGDFFARFGGARGSSTLALTSVSVVVVLAILAAVNYMVAKHPKEIDLTREGVFTLSEQTTGVLQRLSQPVKIYAFFTTNEREYGSVDDTLRRYAGVTDKLTYEMVDVANRPDLVERYSLQQNGPRIVVIAGENDARVKDISEEALTNAVAKVTQSGAKAVYFLTGHGERDLDDDRDAKGMKMTADAVRGEGFEVKTLDFTKGAAAAPGTAVDLKATDKKPTLSVPADAAVLVVAGPRLSLLEPEVAALSAYLDRGGRVVLLLDPDNDGGLGGLLAQYKITLHNDLVVDTSPVNQLLGYGAAGAILKPLGDHPTIVDMAAPAMMFMGRSLEIADGGESGVNAIALLGTGDAAWGETDYKSGRAERDDKDTAGPVSMAAIAVKPTNHIDAKATPEARLFVAGDSDWVDNQLRSVQGNPDLFLNVLAWLAEEENKITIRPKTRAASQLLLTGDQMNTLVFASMDVLPVLLIALGSAIVLLRRQR
ncbi:MAG: GldG family protein [Myxococcota bacterium]